MDNNNELKTISNTLKEFLLNSIDDGMSDGKFWDEWEFSQFKYGTPCWELKNCTSTACKFYGALVPKKCWLSVETHCCKEDKYIQKIQRCLNCSVFKQYGNYPVRELYELISLLIKFMKSRDNEMFVAATKDGLTGVYNRLYFEDFIKHQLNIAERYHESMSVILVDLDKFKIINDTFGHDVGDIVLKGCVDIFRKTIRTSDLIFRYGGDEFLIFLPRTDCDVVEVMKMRIAEEIDKWNEELDKTYKGIKVGVSVGCSTWKIGDNIQQKIKDADMDMYENKSFVNIKA